MLLPLLLLLAPAQPIDVTPLAEGVWMHTSVRTVEGYGEVPTNGLIVDGPDGVTLIDTAWTDAQTEEVLDWAEETLGRPVTAAIVTHAHSDKMGGMATLHARGVETYAAPLTNALAPSRDLLPAKHDFLLSEDGEAAGGPAGIDVYYPGAGHTADNIVAYLPEARILFGGCLIRPAGSTTLGNTADGDVGHWDEAADAAAERFPDAEIVVPSHGPPAGPELLSLTASLAREARP